MTKEERGRKVKLPKEIKIKEIILSPRMLWFFLILKMFVYYLLIDVDLTRNFLALGTVFLLAMVFSHLYKSSFVHKFLVFSIFYAFFSVIMFADTMYFNYYNQTASIQQIYQVSNVAKVPSSFIATLIPASFFIIWDIPIALYYFKKAAKNWEEKEKENDHGKKLRMGLNVGAILLIAFLATNPFQYTLFSRINHAAFFTNHIRDIIEVSVEAVYTELWEPKEVLNVVKEEKEDFVEPVTKEETTLNCAGVAEGKNLIVIQLEAFQNFVIGASYNGQEITPNLNKLVAKDSIYFDNYYSIIGKGNTADAEFATLNSLYPVIDGESYRLYTKNAYNGLPWQLKEEGYETFGFHGNEAVFWNRKEAYPYQGIDHFYNLENMDQKELIGLGISDSSVFSQMIDVLEQSEKPFFSFVVSLTSHHPYELPEEYCELNILPEDEGSKFANYLQSVHYTDQAIGELIEKLKKKGLYERTTIAFYGDHHGLNCTMDDNDVYVGRYLGHDYGYEEMLKVPCIIHIPGSGITKKISTLGCQVDFLPTIATLMNFKIEQPYIMGQNLLMTEHGFAAFTAYLFDGSFAYDNVMFKVSREGIFEGSTAWNRDNLEKVKIDEYYEQYQKALLLKAASKQVLEQNLIKDYVDREDINPEIEQKATTESAIIEKVKS